MMQVEFAVSMRRARLSFDATCNRLKRETSLRSQAELEGWDRGEFASRQRIEDGIERQAQQDIDDECAKQYSISLHVWDAPVSGRKTTFLPGTIAAAVEEFHQRVTSIKRGMCNAALKELLIRKRQALQAPEGTVLEPPSDSCLLSAIEQMDIGPAVSGGFATRDRAVGLENYRNAVSCAATWSAIKSMGIPPGLLFNVDEVGVWLSERGKVMKFMRFPKGMHEEAKERKCSPAMQQTKKQPRMVYMECLTNAEGELCGTIIRIVDNCVPVDKIILKEVEINVYVGFVNSKYAKEAWSKCVLGRVWLPIIKTRQLRETVAMRKSPDALNVADVDSQRLSQGTGSADYQLLDGETLARALLSFDGAHEHIESVMCSPATVQYCQKWNIGLFKWAAGCSLVQQPNDVSKCHKLLHAFFKSARHLFQPEVKRSQLRSGYKQAMSVLDFHGASAESKATFQRFFFNLPSALQGAFMPDAVRKGYSDCGVWPFDIQRIMHGWNPGGKRAKSSWGMLDDQQKSLVLGGIMKLSVIALEKGTVTDEEVDSCIIDDATGMTMEQLFADADVPDYMKCQINGNKINPGKGINRRRCILMTHPAWFRKEIDDRKALAADPKNPRQVYGKDFDHAGCKCGVKSKFLEYHSKQPKHNAHVAKFVAQLRADPEAGLPLDDEAAKLARQWIEKHPVSDPVLAGAVAAPAPLPPLAQNIEEREVLIVEGALVLAEPELDDLAGEVDDDEDAEVDVDQEDFFSDDE